MPKVLILDTDKSLATLAPDERIKQVFGYAPRRFVSATSLSNFLDKFLERIIETTEDELGVVEVETYRLRGGFPLDYLVLDSITALAAMVKIELRNESRSGQLGRSGWDEMADQLWDILYKMVSANVPFVATVHDKPVEDGTDYAKYIPSVQGRIRDELPRMFDVVAYTIVRTDDNGNREYLWQIVPDENRPAKCRYDAVTKWAMSLKTRGLMPQDLALLMTKIRDAGYTNPNILLIGPSGSGKTYSLRTLKNAPQMPQEQETTEDE